MLTFAIVPPLGAPAETTTQTTTTPGTSTPPPTPPPVKDAAQAANIVATAMQQVQAQTPPAPQPDVLAPVAPPLQTPPPGAQPPVPVPVPPPIAATVPPGPALPGLTSFSKVPRWAIWAGVAVVLGAAAGIALTR